MPRTPSLRSSERLDAVFHALSDARRRAMVDRLSRGPASVSELAEPTQLALPSAVKHLVLLERSGLVKSRKRGRVRTYHMPANAFSEVERWVERRKATWERRFDKLDQYLAQTGNRSAKRRGS